MSGQVRAPGRDRAGLLILAAVALTTLVPFVWALSMSLKPEEAVFRPGIIPTTTVERAVVDGREVRVRLLRELDDGRVRVKVAEGERRIVDIPASDYRGRTERLDVRWENYPEAWSAYPFLSFGRAYLNSLVVAGLVTLGQVVTSALAAYAFARLRFPGRDALFLAYLATMMVPGAVTMIPTFVLLKSLPDALNWVLGTEWFSRQLTIGGGTVGIDSYFALIAPRCFSAYGTFMLRQYFLGVPRELEEAAYLDGCSSFGVFRHVCLPLARPALATLAIFTFMWAWGDFFWPLIAINSESNFTLPLGLTTFQGQHTTDWAAVMAGNVITVTPVLVAFLLAQRTFIQSLTSSAVKG